MLSSISWHSGVAGKVNTKHEISSLLSVLADSTRTHSKIIITKVIEAYCGHMPCN